ncbi:glucose 1-dehydrogenase [Microbacterium aoyamense]|uniref:Glucose 1-dehydrogenase n=1 Tax=Microbacterium aoyamense TaxID=344166 RepID=A0ABN2PTT6_9MICO|nr:SDR family oxidoreductase [Microbacterium aoyamense]
MNGRIAVITGAALGLGAEFARELRDLRGLVLVDLAGDALDETAARLRAGGADVRTFVADVTDPEAPGSIMALADEAFGGADILVNNAGVVRYAPFLDTDRAFLRDVLAIDVESAYFMTQAFAAERIRTGRGGVVVNLGTSHAIVGVAATSAYAAAKGALHAVTRTLAVELAPYGIRVNTLALGMTMTERVRRELGADVMAGRLRQIPLARGAEPAEAATALRYLIDAEYTTGTELVLDGGFTIYGDG